MDRLSTPEERTAFREKMRSATPEQRPQLMAARRAEIEQRAKERGVTLPVMQPGGGHGGHNWYQTYPQFSLVATNAKPNTGSGGGGGSYIPSGPWTYGGSGGSGVVVIRYLSTFPAAVSVTGNPEAYVAGPYRVYVWSKSGSITF
jgi:hypothetical protein